MADVTPALADTASPGQPRIVQGEHYRYNANLPRGTHLLPGEAEMAVELKIRQLEASIGVAWSEGRQKVAAAAFEKLAPQHGDLPRKTQDELARILSQHWMRAEGPFDEEVHPFFETSRQLAKQIPALRSESQDLMALRLGPPEFEGMRQLTDYPRPQVQTDAFQAWFGASKVTNDQGTPLIAFHGSTQEIHSFRTRPEAYRKGPQGDWTGELGAWFAAPSAWSDYEVGNAENTADVFSLPGNEMKEGSVVYPVYLSIQNPLETEGHDDFMDRIMQAGSVEAFRKKLELQGHDGIVIRGCMTDGDMVRDDWIVFEPQQAKSAIGNNGLFNKNNPDFCDRREFDAVLIHRARKAVDFLESMTMPFPKKISP